MKKMSTRVTLCPTHGKRRRRVLAVASASNGGQALQAPETERKQETRSDGLQKAEVFPADRRRASV